MRGESWKKQSLGLLRRQRSCFARRFSEREILERAMDSKIVVFGLLAASLTNVLCLCALL
jgi:hypothetical protein